MSRDTQVHIKNLQNINNSITVNLLKLLEEALSPKINAK